MPVKYFSLTLVRMFLVLSIECKFSGSSIKLKKFREVIYVAKSFKIFGNDDNK
jgi:hypothetical protein